MLGRILITLGLLGLQYSTPLLAQKVTEEGRLNLSMGGGLSVPLNPTARFAGVGGSFIAGGGYNLNRHNSIVGQFMWDGLPQTLGVRLQLNGLSAGTNLYSLTANYKY